MSDVQTSKFKEFGSRKDIENYLQEMNAFLHNEKEFKVENVHGVDLGSYQDLKKVQKAMNKTNRDKAKLWDMVKDQPFTHRGVPTGVTVAQQKDPVLGMGDVRFSDLEPVKFRDPNTFFSKKEWEDYKKNKMDVYGDGRFVRRLNQLYKENYLKALRDNLGEPSKRLQEHIQNMSMEDFIKMNFTENNASIDFIYDRLTIHARVAELERVWRV